MAHSQKPSFVFRRNGRVHLNRRGVSSVDYWQASCSHRPAGFILLVQACVLQSCNAYWLPTHSLVSPSILPFVSLCHYISNGLYQSPPHIIFRYQMLVTTLRSHLPPPFRLQALATLLRCYLLQQINVCNQTLVTGVS
jgi:hypothetical protein